MVLLKIWSWPLYIKVLNDTSKIILPKDRDVKASQECLLKWKKPTDSGTSSKWRPEPSNKGVGIYTCVCTAVFVKELEEFAASFWDCLYTMIMQELEIFTASYWATSTLFVLVLAFVLTSFHTFPLVFEYSCLSLLIQ